MRGIMPSSQAWKMFVRRAHGMSFAEIFQQSNSSFSPLRGKTVSCTVRPLQGNMVSVDTGLKAPIVCFQDELGTQVTEKTKIPFGIDRLESFGEPRMILPRDLEQKSRVKLIWTELERIWRSDRNLVKGLVMNKVNGGYAVGIAGNIAFVPRSMLGSKRIFPHNPWRMFTILNMNPKIGNIVVREAPRLGFRPTTRPWLPTVPSWSDRRPNLSDSRPRSSSGQGLPTSGFWQGSVPASGFMQNGNKASNRVPDVPAAGSKQAPLRSSNGARARTRGSLSSSKSRL